MVKKFEVKGELVTVDRDIYESLEVESYSWHLDSNGYVRSGESIYLHLLILPAKRGYQVDHVNRNILDNRLANLRYGNYRENQLNTENRGGVSDYKGVSKDKSGNWRSRIRVPGEESRREVGGFKSEEYAALSYNLTAYASCIERGDDPEFLFLNEVSRQFKKKFRNNYRKKLERLYNLGVTDEILDLLLE